MRGRPDEPSELAGPLQAQNAELRLRLAELEDTLESIRRGDVDALVVDNDLYLLGSAHAAANRMRQEVLAQMEDAVFAFDAEEHVVYMNAAAERRYAVAASEALGRHRSAIFVEAPAPQGTDSGLGELLPSARRPSAFATHRLANGTAIHVESVVSPLLDAEGRVAGSLAVIRDVGARLEAEQAVAEAAAALARRERQFATLVENAPDVVARLDRALRFRYVNPAVERHWELPAAGCVGRSAHELALPAALCDALDGAARGVFLSGREDRIEFPFEAASGALRSFEARLLPECSEGGEVESVLCIASDVTERQAMDTALREADRRKDEFLATLAHELRNPLAPITNAIQIMRMTSDAGAHEDARSIIERQLGQMVHLVADLLDVSRISQGKVELRRQPTDLHNVLQTALETSRPLIDAGKHRLTVRLSMPRTARVMGDPTRLSQILSNLLNNAAKYTPEGGRIDMAAEVEDAQAIVTVQDSGIGIPPGMLPRVFDMFAQVDRARDRAQGGLGIGLALVRKLVELHGGSVHAHSDGEGRGSRFVVRLPLLSATADAGGAAPAALAAPRTGVFTVLVVDDSPDSALSMSKIMELLGYRTVVAHDGLAAVQLAERHRPLVVLMDIGLPLLDGRDAARRIREGPGGHDMLLIAISGWGQEHDIEQSRRAGFDHHFVKPVDLARLTEVIGAFQAGLAGSRS